MNIIDRLRKKTFRGIQNFNMIKDGDKVLIAVSGGKDSLVLLDLLAHLQKFSQIKFDLVACYVVPQTPGIITFENELSKIFESYGIEYVIQHLCIPEGSKLGEGIQEAKTCQRCAYSRRIALFKLAENIGATKIVYAHHMDDMITTFWQNMHVNKELKIMLPVNKMRKGDFWIIRPMVYIREDEVIKYSLRTGIKPMKAECSLADKINRNQIKNILRETEKKLPGFVEHTLYSYIKKLPDEIGYVGK